MLADTRSVPNGATITADVCIVGAGAAGITAARELTAPTRRVVLLESGFDEPDPATQSLYDGESRASRTSRWATRTLHTPVRGQHEPVERRVSTPERARLRDPHVDPGQRMAVRPRAPAAVLQPRAGRVRARTVCVHGHGRVARRRGRAHRDPVQRADALRTAVSRCVRRAESTTVYLGANVVDLATTPSGRAVERVEAVTIAGSRFTVTARSFVLATGGIEEHAAAARVRWRRARWDRQHPRPRRAHLHGAPVPR